MRRVGLVLLLVSTLLLAGCSATATPISEPAPTETTTSGNAEVLATATSDSEEQQTAEPVILYYPGSDWGYPSPFGAYLRGPGYTQMSFLFDTLVWRNETEEIGLIATEWSSSEDGIEWTFVIRPDVSFHDGEALTIEDVVFSYTFIAEHSTEFGWSVDLANIASVEAVSEDTVKFVLTNPSPDFDVVTAGVVPIIPEHVWSAVDNPEEYREDDALIGSGPYTLESYSAEEGSYVYVANESYFLGSPVVDRLIFTPVQDSALALETGTVDAASFSGKEVSAVNELLQDTDLSVIEGMDYWVLQIVFNTQSGVFADLAARQTAAISVDRQSLVDQVAPDGAVVANTGIIAPNCGWYAESENVPEYDPDAAAAAVQELGLDDQEVLLITTSTYAREAELIKADLEAAGFAVTLQTGDTATVDTLLSEGSFDLAINGHGGNARTTTLRVPDWPAGIYESAAYDELYAKQASELDAELRAQYVAELQQMVTDDLPVLTLYHPRMWCIYDATVFDGWFFTEDGYSMGIPMVLNKMIFIEQE